ADAAVGHFRVGSSSAAAKMADGEEVTLDGRPLHLLRVADLKAALERRGLAKSGQKSALVKRLRGVSGDLMVKIRTEGKEGAAC
uniref:SAP domain-containing protein n=1 Tax=Coturnix japonica TaxID=93934 RepID=A0A8C2SUE9_COTJA